MSEKDTIMVMAVCVIVTLASLVTNVKMAARLGEERAARKFWRDLCQRTGGHHE